MQLKVQICYAYATSKCGILGWVSVYIVGSSKNWAFRYLQSLIPLNNSIKIRY